MYAGIKLFWRLGVLCLWHILAQLIYAIFPTSISICEFIYEWEHAGHYSAKPKEKCLFLLAPSLYRFRIYHRPVLSTVCCPQFKQSCRGCPAVSGCMSPGVCQTMSHESKQQISLRALSSWQSDTATFCWQTSPRHTFAVFLAWEQLLLKNP